MYQISQRRYFLRANFQFQDDHLCYRGRDWEFNVKYTNIPPATRYKSGNIVTRVPETLSTMYFGALLFLLMRHDGNPHYGASGLRWALQITLPLVASATVIVYFLRQLWGAEYTSLMTTQGEIVIYKAKNYQKIIEELESRRLKSLRLLIEPNLANSMDEEKAKLKWLLSEGVINTHEYEKARAIAELGRPVPPD